MSELAPAPAVPAATVVVMRPGAPRFEVLMVRRHATLEVLAGAHVFPGGRIDDDDRLPSPETCCDGLEALSRIPGLDAAGELAVRVAAARELLEEAGILLARREGRFATAAEASAVRSGLAPGVAFASLLTAGGWRLALDALVPFGRIVTPRPAPRRFDTHFLLTTIPVGQEASHCGAESDDLVWVAPAAAIGGDRPAGLSIAPPTWITLALLASNDNLQGALDWAAGRTITSVEPVLRVEGDLRRVTFPNDPALGAFNGPDGIHLLGDSRHGWRTTLA